MRRCFSQNIRETIYRSHENLDEELDCNFALQMRTTIPNWFIMNQSAIDLATSVSLVLLTATTETTKNWDMSSWIGQVL